MMKIKAVIGGFQATPWVIALIVSAACITSEIAAQTGPQQAGQTTEPTPLRFTAYTLPSGTDTNRLSLLADALDFSHWPRTEALFAAPRIDKSLLDDPSAVTHESHSCARVRFGDTLWHDCNWSWRALAPAKNSQPAELPAEHKASLLDKLTQEQRADEIFVNNYLDQQQRQYQRRQKYQVEGQLDIEVCTTPNDLGAKEFLLTRLTNNMMPAQDLANMYEKNAQQSAELGTLSYVIASRRNDDMRITFVRNNIFVQVRAVGSLSTVALALARKIDTAIYQQPALSVQELLEQQRKLSGINNITLP
jgi:hypothetical protein